jgi:hypothetical protein
VGHLGILARTFKSQRGSRTTDLRLYYEGVVRKDALVEGAPEAPAP